MKLRWFSGPASSAPSPVLLATLVSPPGHVNTDVQLARSAQRPVSVVYRKCLVCRGSGAIVLLDQRGGVRSACGFCQGRGSRAEAVS